MKGVVRCDEDSVGVGGTAIPLIERGKILECFDRVE
jgi:hypothetical protein